MGQTFTRPHQSMLDTHFKKELERLQRQQITAPLGVEEAAEWCNSFVLVSKANPTV